jgi:type IV pilus assembly protein PilB
MSKTLDEVSFSASTEEEKLSWELTNKIFTHAFQERVSDIHLEPDRGGWLVRFRIDGILREISRHPQDVGASVNGIVRKLADMAPESREKLQSGKIMMKVPSMENRIFDMRASTFPTIFGEKIVLRVLDPSSIEKIFKMGFEAINIEGDNLSHFKQIVEKPFGIVIFTGPTGSGKTTTAYAALSHLARSYDGRCNIVSLEDPVECVIEGVVQTAVKDGESWGFSQALRGLMRQDPDIIFCSSIPDPETARMVFEVAATGHLIMTQLSSSDCAEAIYGLWEMGMEPYFLSMTLEGLTNQRLVRKICPNCREEVKPAGEMLEMVKEVLDFTSDVKSFFRGRGCEHCRHTGYRGRAAVYEIVPRTDSFPEIISSRKSLAELRSAIGKLGFPSIKKAAVDAAILGLTSLEEAVRVTWVKR